MIIETLDLMQEVYGVSQKALLAQAKLSRSGLRYLKGKPTTKSKGPTLHSFYETIRVYVDPDRIKKLDPYVKANYLRRLKATLAAAPSSVHRDGLIEEVERQLGTT